MPPSCVFQVLKQTVSTVPAQAGIKLSCSRPKLTLLTFTLTEDIPFQHLVVLCGIYLYILLPFTWEFLENRG
jgi:hypothetical protein